MFKFNAVRPPTSGWLEVWLEDEVVQYLSERISEASVSVKDTLAGNISESLDLEDKDNFFLKNVLLDCANNYVNSFPFSQKKPDSIGAKGELTLNGFWVNYQKQHEFNPMHDHGGLYSFVIWMKIPTTHEEQHNLDFVKGMKNPCASNFELTYIDTTGAIKAYPYYMDPDKEGKMLFFPSTLKHAVYPFYQCDGERISISGNLYYT
tara:strand:+ start:186 stop:803 length:618 start_codon:yes stop_codon:yes gene_type:complete